MWSPWSGRTGPPRSAAVRRRAPTRRTRPASSSEASSSTCCRRSPEARAVLEAELLRVRAGVDLARLEDVVDELPRLREGDLLLPCGDPVVDVRLARVVGGEREAL